MTLGNAVAAKAQLIVWCRECGRQVEPDHGAMVEHCGADRTVIDWHAHLLCTGCGSRQIDFVATGTRAAIGCRSPLAGRIWKTWCFVRKGGDPTIRQRPGERRGCASRSSAAANYISENRLVGDLQSIRVTQVH
jgi:hypothetical protein